MNTAEQTPSEPPAVPSPPPHRADSDWQGPRELERRLTALETRIKDNRWFMGVVVVPIVISAGALVVAIVTAAT